MPEADATRPARGRALSLLAATAGLALFVYAVRRAGVDEILGGVRRVGWGLVLIIALGGLRFLLRTECWRLCVPGPIRLSFGHAFVAFLAGDAVGSVTPLGLLASEPTKVFLTRHHLATRESVASLTLENLVYSASVLVMVGIGVVVLLATASVPPLVQQLAVASLAGLALLVAAAVTVVRVRANRTSTLQLPAWLGALGGVAAEVHQFSVAQPGRLWRVFLLDLVYHGVAVAEVFVTLQWLMGARSPTLVTAIVFEALNRVVTIAFKFVPFRVGVDEALTGALAPLLAVDPASGVALAVVRKVRSLFWAAVGLSAIATHPARDSQSA